MANVVEVVEAKAWMAGVPRFPKHLLLSSVNGSSGVCP